MDQCDIYATVNFGRGPVEVRCTQTGEHEEHRCNVYIQRRDLDAVEHANDERTVQLRNVFNVEK